MKIFHIVAAYQTQQVNLVEGDLCRIEVRGKEPRLTTMKDVYDRFYNIPWVKGCGGIMEAYIFDTETRTMTPVVF